LNTLASAADVDATSLVSLATNLASMTANVDELSNTSAATASAIALSILTSANNINVAYTGTIIILITITLIIIIITIIMIRFIKATDSNEHRCYCYHKEHHLGQFYSTG